MPADARAHVRKLASGRWQLRYPDREGVRRSGGAHSSKTAAWNHYRDVIEPELDGTPAAWRDLKLQELVDVFLERHETVASKRTVKTLKGRLVRPLKEFGETPLADLERMTDEIAGFAAKLPERYRYSVVSGGDSRPAEFNNQDEETKLHSVVYRRAQLPAPLRSPLLGSWEQSVTEFRTPGGTKP